MIVTSAVVFTQTLPVGNCMEFFDLGFVFGNKFGLHQGYIETTRLVCIYAQTQAFGN